MSADRHTGESAPGDMHTLVDRFRARLRASGRMDDATAVVVGVSGGIDSMTLLYLLRFHGAAPSLPIHAAHVDHRMREGSGVDAAWVAEICARWGVACQVRTASEPVGTEALGRELRYAFFEEVRRGLGPGAVTMTGHTADDQAETVLFRIARGSGPRGLGGVRPERAPSLVRPLLPFWRRELEAFAAASGIPFREDPTNRDPRWTRNQLRHNILPALEEAVPGAAAALAALAGTSQVQSAALDELLDHRIAVLATAASPRPPTPALSLDREALGALSDPVLTLLLRRAVSRLGGRPGRAATAALLGFARRSPSGRHLVLAGGVTVERRLGEIRIRPTGEEDGATPAAIPSSLRITSASGHGVFSGGGLAAEVAWGSPPGRGFPCVADFAPAAVRFPLIVRLWEPGDRMTMSYGRKKVKKILLEARIPADRRKEFLVVADAGGEVLWVPGLTEPSPEARPAPGRQTCRVEVRFDHEPRHD